jgi:replicative DNA helicase
VVAREIYERIIKIVSLGKKVPPLSIFICDQSLSDEARAFLGNSNNVLYKEKDVLSAIDLLKQYRNKKLLTEACVACIEKLNTQKPNLSNVVTLLENALQKCYSTDHFEDDINVFSKENCETLVQNAAKELEESNDNNIIPTGFYEFDKRTGGIRRGNVLVLASVPGGGKSAMAFQMAIYQYIMGFNVCFVSYEMESSELKYRLYANLSKVNHSEINMKRLSKSKKEIILTRYKEWLQGTPNTNIFTLWHPTRELTIPQIVAEIKSKNYDMVYIDYLSLLAQNPKKQMWENLGDHTRAAKLAASNLDAGCVVLAQYDDESNKIKYSKAIIANADFVWVWDYGNREKETGIIEIQQKKARSAATYPFYLDADYSIFSIKDYRGPTPIYNDTKNDNKNYDNEEKNEIKNKKKKLENKTIAQKLEMDKVVLDSTPVPQADKRGIPKMPQLV